MNNAIWITFPFRAITKDNEKYFNPYTRRPFTSAKFKDFEKRCREYARREYKDEPLTGHIRVHLHFYFKNNVRPDLFNLPKSICDAMQGILYKNDHQITRGTLMVTINNNKDNFYIGINKIIG